MGSSKAIARSAAQQTVYTGKVLQDGHLSLPKMVQRKLGLQQGDAIRVLLRPVEAASIQSKRELPDSVRAQVEELVGPQPTRQQAVAGLVKVAHHLLPPRKQRRLSHLLWKNQAGEITREEEKELDELIAEGEQGTIRKAKAILALRQLGVDIVPELQRFSFE